MKQTLFIIFLLLMTTLVSAQQNIEITDEQLQAAVDESLSKGLGGKLICGNNICQEGEQISCPSDCPANFGDVSCIKDGIKTCSPAVILMYVVFAIILYTMYENQKKGRRKK